MDQELNQDDSSHLDGYSKQDREDVRMDTNFDDSSHMEIDQQNQKILSLCREMEQELENLTRSEENSKSKVIDTQEQSSTSIGSANLAKERSEEHSKDQEPEESSKDSAVDNESVGARKRKQTFTPLQNSDITFISQTVSDSILLLSEHSTCENKTVCENDTASDETGDNYMSSKDSECPYVLKTVPDSVKLDVDVLDKPIKNPSPAKARKVSVLSSSVSKLSIKDANEAKSSNSDLKSVPSTKDYDYIPSKRFLKPLYLKPPDTPIERPRQMIRFLEAKKKNVHYDRLHHWVLWNENLKRAHIKRNDKENVQAPSPTQMTGDKSHQAMQREEKIRRDCSRGYLPLC